MYDAIIIGAGPAGISAALYAKRANLSVLVLYHGESQLGKAHKIDNYYGFVDGITGAELYAAGIGSVAGQTMASGDYVYYTGDEAFGTVTMGEVTTTPVSSTGESASSSSGTSFMRSRRRRILRPSRRLSSF